MEILRVKGQASAAKRAGRSTSEGTVASYIHATGKIGVLVEVQCETDFVARNDEFQELAREVALPIVASTATTICSLLTNTTDGWMYTSTAASCSRASWTGMRIRRSTRAE